MRYKRVTVFCGHYGSGKTNIAVNIAMMLAKEREKVALADIDIVNPYYRSADSAKELNAAGVRLISSGFANSNVDLPSMPDEIYGITDDRATSFVLDVGGDDRGALALGRLSGRLKEEDDYEMLLVVNMYRPLTRTADEVVEVQREIEAAGRLPFTGIINNSNLGAETEARDVICSLAFAEEVSKKSGLPIVMTTVEDRLYEAVRKSVEQNELMALRLQKRPI